MVERKMLRSAPIVVSGKLAANAPWQKLQIRENNQSGVAGHPAESRTPPEWHPPGCYARRSQGGINPRQILPDDACRRIRQAGNRLFTTDRIMRMEPLKSGNFIVSCRRDRSGRLRCPACLLLTTRPTFAR